MQGYHIRQDLVWTERVRSADSAVTILKRYIHEESLRSKHDKEKVAQRAAVLTIALKIIEAKRDEELLNLRSAIDSEIEYLKENPNDR